MRFASLFPNNSKNTNWRQNSLAGTDHWNTKLSTNIQYEKSNYSVFLIFQKTCKNINKKTHIFDIFWVFKSKLQIIHPVTYIHCFFLNLINVFYMFSTIRPYLSMFSFCVIIFTFFFLLISPRDTFYILQCLMISLQLARISRR